MREIPFWWGSKGVQTFIIAKQEDGIDNFVV